MYMRPVCPYARRMHASVILGPTEYGHIRGEALVVSERKRAALQDSQGEKNT
jgi:hypothetical protein